MSKLRTLFSLVSGTYRAVADLLNRNEDLSEGTAYPFWFVAVNGGAIWRRPVMVSEGIWFSREAAEQHLEAKRHRYPKKAFVWCASAHDSPTGLRGFYEALKALDAPEASIQASGVEVKTDLDDLLVLCEQLAEWVENPNDSLKDTILSRYEDSAIVYVKRVKEILSGGDPLPKVPDKFIVRAKIEATERGSIILDRNKYGDISVTIRKADRALGSISLGLRFCTKVGGGTTPNTLKALRELMKAMKADGGEVVEL